MHAGNTGNVITYPSTKYAIVKLYAVLNWIRITSGKGIFTARRHTINWTKAGANLIRR